jgi:hypothetical protein
MPELDGRRGRPPPDEAPPPADPLTRITAELPTVPGRLGIRHEPQPPKRELGDGSCAQRNLVAARPGMHQAQHPLGSDRPNRPTPSSCQGPDEADREGEINPAERLGGDGNDRAILSHIQPGQRVEHSGPCGPVGPGVGRHPEQSVLDIRNPDPEQREYLPTDPRPLVPEVAVGGVVPC